MLPVRRPPTSYFRQRPLPAGYARRRSRSPAMPGYAVDRALAATASAMFRWLLRLPHAATYMLSVAHTRPRTVTFRLHATAHTLPPPPLPDYTPLWLIHHDAIHAARPPPDAIIAASSASE